MLRGIDISNHNHNYIRKNNIDIRNDFDILYYDEY